MAPKAITLSIRRSESLIRWLDEAIDGIDVPANGRVRMASACLDLAMEHQKGIILPIRLLVCASPSCLRILRARCLASSCATSAKLKSFESGKVECSAELLRKVEIIKDFQDGILSTAKQKSWTAMNDSTHGGYIHATYRNKEISIEPTYAEDEILEVIGFANAIGLLSSLEAARLAGNDEMINNVLQKSIEFWNGPGRRPE